MHGISSTVSAWAYGQHYCLLPKEQINFTGTVLIYVMEASGPDFYSIFFSVCNGEYGCNKLTSNVALSLTYTSCYILYCIKHFNINSVDPELWDTPESNPQACQLWNFVSVLYFLLVKLSPLPFLRVFTHGLQPSASRPVSSPNLHLPKLDLYMCSSYIRT